MWLLDFVGDDFNSKPQLVIQTKLKNKINKIPTHQNQNKNNPMLTNKSITIRVLVEAMVETIGEVTRAIRHVLFATSNGSFLQMVVFCWVLIVCLEELFKNGFTSHATSSQGVLAKCLWWWCEDSGCKNKEFEARKAERIRCHY